LGLLYVLFTADGDGDHLGFLRSDFRNI